MRSNAWQRQASPSGPVQGGHGASRVVRAYDNPGDRRRRTSQDHRRQFPGRLAWCGTQCCYTDRPYNAAAGATRCHKPYAGVVEAVCAGLSAPGPHGSGVGLQAPAASYPAGPGCAASPACTRDRSPAHWQADREARRADRRYGRTRQASRSSRVAIPRLTPSATTCAIGALGSRMSSRASGRARPTPSSGRGRT